MGGRFEPSTERIDRQPPSSKPTEAVFLCVAFASVDRVTFDERSRLTYSPDFGTRSADDVAFLPKRATEIVKASSRCH